jgi:hypothetical protein
MLKLIGAGAARLTGGSATKVLMGAPFLRGEGAANVSAPVVCNSRAVRDGGRARAP